MYQTFNCEEKYENEQIQMNIYLGKSTYSSLQIKKSLYIRLSKAITILAVI